MDKVKLSLILNGVLGAAVIVLFILFLSGKQKTEGQDEVAASPAAEKEAIKSGETAADTLPDLDLPDLQATGNLRVAFIDLDELQKKYGYFSANQQRLTRRMEQLESKIQEKRQEYAQEVQAYQQNAPTMGEIYRKTKEEKITELEKEIQSLMEEYQFELPKEIEDFNKNYYKKLDDYISKHSKEKGYDYVLGYAKGGPSYVFFANDTLEITGEVLKGLNK